MSELLAYPIEDINDPSFEDAYTPIISIPTNAIDYKLRSVDSFEKEANEQKFPRLKIDQNWKLKVDGDDIDEEKVKQDEEET